jgi:hypothetical protein
MVVKDEDGDGGTVVSSFDEVVLVSFVPFALDADLVVGVMADDMRFQEKI